MLKTIASLQGVSILSRDAQKKISGGVAAAGGTCRMTYTAPNGQTSTYTTTFSGSCSQQSAAANSTCVNMLDYMNTSGDRCSYDCGCDGWGV
jgi:hypothetical protein